tara:strand:+ start:1244 stop:1720 length:477 start_codon:yes stop_codon:yes gene_type:complete
MSWFAAKTKTKGEFKAMSFFNSVGINSYVPSYRTKKVWSDRIKKVIVPAISGYVFFELEKINFDALNLNPFTKCVVRGVNGLPAIIKDEEITTLKKHLSGEELGSEASFFEGQEIKISSGPFIYKKGVINKVNYNRVVINIESININLILKKSSILAA